MSNSNESGSSNESGVMVDFDNGGDNVVNQVATEVVESVIEEATAGAAAAGAATVVATAAAEARASTATAEGGGGEELISPSNLTVQEKISAIKSKLSNTTPQRSKSPGPPRNSPTLESARKTKLTDRMKGINLELDGAPPIAPDFAYDKMEPQVTPSAQGFAKREEVVGGESGDSASSSITNMNDNEEEIKSTDSPVLVEAMREKVVGGGSDDSASSSITSMNGNEEEIKSTDSPVLVEKPSEEEEAGGDDENPMAFNRSAYATNSIDTMDSAPVEEPAREVNLDVPDYDEVDKAAFNVLTPTPAAVETDRLKGDATAVDAFSPTPAGSKPAAVETERLEGDATAVDLFTPTDYDRKPAAVETDRLQGDATAVDAFSPTPAGSKPAAVEGKEEDGE